MSTIIFNLFEQFIENKFGKLSVRRGKLDECYLGNERKHLFTRNKFESKFIEELISGQGIWVGFEYKSIEETELVGMFD